MNFKDAFKESVKEFFSKVNARIKQVLIHATKLLLIIIALTALSGSVYLVVNKFVQLKQEANELVSQENKKAELVIRKLEQLESSDLAAATRLRNQMEWDEQQKINEKTRLEKARIATEERLERERIAAEKIRESTKGLTCHIQKKHERNTDNVIGKKLYLIILKNEDYIELVQWDKFNYPLIVRQKNYGTTEMSFTGPSSTYLIKGMPDTYIGKMEIERAGLTFKAKSTYYEGYTQGRCFLTNHQEIRAMVQKEQDRLNSQRDF